MPTVEWVTPIAKVISGTQQGLARAAEIIGGMMKSNAKLNITDAVYATPEKWYIRTGDLRDRINNATIAEDHAITIVVGSPMEYAPYVELGTGIYASDGTGRKTAWSYMGQDGNWHSTRGVPARPFLRPAVEDHVEDYKKVLMTELARP